jgi:hypothetical protein
VAEAAEAVLALRHDVIVRGPDSARRGGAAFRAGAIDRSPVPLFVLTPTRCWRLPTIRGSPPAVTSGTS